MTQSIRYGLRYGLLALSLVVVACGGGGDDADASFMSTDARPIDGTPPSGPSLTVTVSPVSPGGVKADNTTANGLNVTVDVHNFTLEAPGGANVDDHGHYQLFLDSSTTPLVTDFATARQLAIPTGTAQGAHTIRGELRQNDGTPLSPAATDASNNFTVVP